MNFIPAAFRPGRQPVGSVEDGFSDSTIQAPQGFARQPTVLPSEDLLSTFRHMVGIHSTRALGVSNGVADHSHNNLHFDGRAAPNLGIYNRVCHREQEAKRGYKFSSFLINGCLGLQIIVAAALTAMGAAGSSHVGVTAFGAINTVIAGLLTYLKGSGLPNRLRYYENEWKKVREYIEQRERDFSRPDCRLDVHEVVRVIETMYDEVKADVQTNTPDSYVSVGDIRSRISATNPQVPRLAELTQHASGHASKFQNLELKYGPRISEFLETLAHKEEERLRDIEKSVGAHVGSHIDVEKSRALGTVKDLEKEYDLARNRFSEGTRNLEKDVEARALSTAKEFEQEYDTSKNKALNTAHNLEREIEDNRARVIDAAHDVEKNAERQRDNLSRLRQDLDDVIHVHGKESRSPVDLRKQ